MAKRYIFPCAITRLTIDIRKANTVKIAGKNLDGKPFVVFAKMNDFFKRFANHPDVPKPLPGLRPYRSRKFPHIRFVFNPARFGEHIGTWKPGALFCKLMGGTETPKPEQILGIDQTKDL